MNLFVPIFWLTDSTVGQCVPNMIRISPKIFFVARMGDSLLEEISVAKFKAYPFFQMIQRIMKSEMVDKDG